MQSSSRRLSQPATRLMRQTITAIALACMGHAALASPQAAVQPGPDGRYYGYRADQFGNSGFVEGEFRMSGLAKRYKASGTLGADGKWNATVVSANTPYNTAMVVRRPADPAKFNGIVIVEWLNVSSGYDIDVDWGMSHELFLREGYAYIGVNAQKVGIEGLQKYNAARYGELDISHDDLSYDIFSQIGQAVRDQASVLLGGLQPVKVFATGHSQSAMRLTTYANAIQPLDKVYDGIMIHGRANTGTKLASSDNTPSNVLIRNDLSVPVFQLQSEMDVAFQSGTSKAMDTAKVRYWEVAGAAHADEYLLDQIYSVSGREIGFYPPNCLKPANRMPFYAAQNAAYHHLTQWATQGIAPPTAPRIQRDWLGFIKKDRDGNALGGLRLPDIDVPVAQYGYANFTTGSLAFLDLFSCIAGGSTDPFSAYKLNKLYPTKADYVSKYEAAAAAARAAGYLLAPDQATLVQKARQAQIPK